MKRPLIAGNWKMNKTPLETVKLIEELKPLLRDAYAEVVICPASTCLFAARAAAQDSNIILGAQNVFYEDSGAYTGEVSCDSLLELGVQYVIVGHSERRRYFKETCFTVNKKVLKTLEKGLRPIICVGEDQRERELGVTAEIVRAKTKKALFGALPTDLEKMVIVYEPDRPTGQDSALEAQDANNTIREIRAAVGELFPGAQETVRILYGGIITPENASQFFSMSDIDGGLIGEASLHAGDFARIVNF